ncbi:MAG: lyase family protein [Zestosphaera sp.]
MTPIIRERVASNLFGGVVYNTLNASGGRDFITLTMALDASLLTFLSRIVEDLIIYSMPQLNYVRLPSEHLATSSIMPHKKNPVTLEVVRTRAAEATGHLVASLSVLKGLSSGYSLDLQEIDKHVFKVLQNTVETVEILTDVVEKLEVNSESVMRDLRNYPVLASELAELITIRSGRPYREVYEEMAELVRNSREAVELYEAVRAKYGINLSYEDAVLLRPVKGSTSSESVLTYLSMAEREVELYRSKLSGSR